eukprot:355668-Chlamydomonas_euryale.AAC.12
MGNVSVQRHLVRRARRVGRCVLRWCKKGRKTGGLLQFSWTTDCGPKCRWQRGTPRPRQQRFAGTAGRCGDTRSVGSCTDENVPLRRAAAEGRRWERAWRAPVGALRF